MLINCDEERFAVGNIISRGPQPSKRFGRFHAAMTIISPRKEKHRTLLMQTEMLRFLFLRTETFICVCEHDRLLNKKTLISTTVLKPQWSAASILRNGWGWLPLLEVFIQAYLFHVPFLRGRETNFQFSFFSLAKEKWWETSIKRWLFAMSFI